jgi:exosortase/archaeosortase family protein
MSIRTNPFHTGGYQRTLFLISFVIMLAGLGVALLISKWSRLLGVALFLLGGSMLYLTSRLGPSSVFPSQRGLIFQRDEFGRLPILSERIVNLYTRDGKYPQLMLITGILLAAAVLVYNLYFQVNTYLGSNDYVVLLLAFSIGSYFHIPEKYSVERDFMLMFIFLLFLIVVLPTTYYSQAYGTTEGGWEDDNPDSPIIHLLLAKPLSILMNTFTNLPHVDANGVLLTYHDIDGNRLEVSIALGCTGLYSASIFLSAFISYILVEYRQFDSKVGVFLLLGIITSYIANLFRMIIILLVGYYYGMDALLTAHANVGELIFMFWIAIFWGFMFKYLEIKTPWENQPFPGSSSLPSRPSPSVSDSEGKHDGHEEHSSSGIPADPSSGGGESVRSSTDRVTETDSIETETSLVETGTANAETETHPSDIVSDKND